MTNSQFRQLLKFTRDWFKLMECPRQVRLLNLALRAAPHDDPKVVMGIRLSDETWTRVRGLCNQYENR